MMSNNTDQKEDHIAIAINPAATTTASTTPSADTTPTIHSTKILKSSLHPHPDNDSNTTECDPSSLTSSLPALPEALHLNTSHAGIISNSAGRHSQHRTNSSAFQEVDIATLRSSSNDLEATAESLSDPLTDSSFFNTARRHSAASSSSISSGFVIESPTLDSTPYEFEMQRFNAYDGSSPSTVKFVTTVIPKLSSATSTATTTGAATTTTTPEQTKPTNSFFTGWMAVPPSLAGRPKLTQDQEDYIRREYERGPVPLMWAKNDDIENQPSTPAAPTTAAAAAPVSTSWFGSWSFRSRSASTSTTAAATAEAATTVTAPPRAAVAPMSSDSGRREASHAL
ncbi:hypothetical protein BGZ95_011568 [Linnemannia exigua]|uniref:Uncharacterized protein n=1 Tax=Linnemannia exigua TaxID=604196 RepID=A0AAD4H6B8_9FUNG|nr:hypothetical protein BGZ95_011568 [Linnemannia exigua]